MIFVAICQHAPERCPASNREVWELVMDTQSKIPDLETKIWCEEPGYSRLALFP